MRDYILVLLVTAAVTYMLTPLVRRLAIRAGALHEARDRDVHVVPIPRFGGLAMFGGLAAGLLVADRIPQLRDAFANTGMVSGLLLAGGLLVAIGIVDDRWGMSALTKLAGQVAAGGILVGTGTQLSWLPLPGGRTFIPTTDQATVVTILIVVATINAVNFIDGLDGLAAGIVAIAAVSFFLYYYSMTRVIDISSLAAPALASAVLIGMCLGFLPHNFYPASIFMGDTGSMLLGLLLAYAPISSIASVPPAVLANSINRYPEILPLLLPAALLVIPYADLLLAVVRRTRAGTSPFAPDRKHLHHRLLDIGHSQRASVLIMYLWAALFSGSVVFLSIEKNVRGKSANHHGQPILVLVGITVAAVAALLLMSMPRLRWWEGRARRSTAASPRLDLPAEPQLVPAGVGAASHADQLATSGRSGSPVPSDQDGYSASGELARPAAPSDEDGYSANGDPARRAALGATSEPDGRIVGSGDVPPAGRQRGLFEPASAEPSWVEPVAGERPGPDRSESALLNAAWADPADPPPPAGGRALPPRSIIGTVPPAISTTPDTAGQPDLVAGGQPAEPLADASSPQPLPPRLPTDLPARSSWPDRLPRRQPADPLADRSSSDPLPPRQPADPLADRPAPEPLPRRLPTDLPARSSWPDRLPRRQPAEPLADRPSPEPLPRRLPTDLPADGSRPDPLPRRLPTDLPASGSRPDPLPRRLPADPLPRGSRPNSLPRRIPRPEDRPGPSGPSGPRP